MSAFDLKHGISPPVIIDAHTHIWSPNVQAYPWAPLNQVPLPTTPASADDLIARLDELGIAGAICIQPSVYGYDHAYLNAMLTTHAHRLAGVCLVNPVRESGPAELRRLVQDYGYRGLRLNPMADPDPRWLDGPEGTPLWQAAIDLELVVSILIAPHQLSRLLTAAHRYPAATIVIDHLGRCTPQTTTVHIQDLLHLADRPNVSVKISALSTLSGQPYPYPNLHPLIKRVYDAYGPDRLLWGTDFPHILDDGPYADSLHAVQDTMPFIKQADLPSILGGNASKLYRVHPMAAPVTTEN
ncbi:MAG TPA: amidohydrolase family protein [Thermomicrobiales bacterium]|nr:amidohydrolase family protein [Thermomicrobiales bacterium]